MRRWLVLLIVLAVAVSALATHTARKKRDAAYQDKLRSYSKLFHPGITRKELEDGLRSSDTNFTRLATRFGPRLEAGVGDLVALGEGTSPFGCTDAHVYVAFVFTPSNSPNPAAIQLNDADLLERIELYSQAGCL
jgi:hypothetical protein